MGSDQAKLEKKRLKAQLKAEKARSGSASESDTSSVQVQSAEKIFWYKNPNWVRAIVAAATLVIMVIPLIFTLLY